MHESEYAHGDIKGTNLLTGLDPPHQHEVQDHIQSWAYIESMCHRFYIHLSMPNTFTFEGLPQCVYIHVHAQYLHMYYSNLQVYLVDYGLAYRYRPQGQQKEYKEDPRRKHDGTLEFTSIDAHKGVSE